MEKYEAAMTEKVSNHIHEDLTISILSKLPVKSLKRFGCVHKSWTLFLQNSFFMSIYRKNFISKNHCDYDDRSYLLRHYVADDHLNLRSFFYIISGQRFENNIKLNYSLPFEDLGRDILVVGSRSINGILGISSTYGSERYFALWNPTIEESKVIPPSPIESIPYRNSSWLIHGFGYDCVRDDYKVIRRTSFCELSEYDCISLGLNEEDVPWEDISYESVWEIYSLRSNSWRKLDINFTTMMIPYNDHEIVRCYMEGMCHWWYKSKSHLYETCLVSFDVSNEVIFTTPMPSNKDDNIDLKWMRRHMVMLINKSIALTSYYKETNTFFISILGEIGVKESWTKLFVVGPLTYIACPIAAGKKGDIFLKKDDGELACFDLETQMIDELGFKAYMSHIIIYNKSLLLIKEISN